MSIMDRLKESLGAGPREPEIKPARNQPCWCGSNKKYKHCHLETDEKKQSADLAKNTCRAPG